MDSLRVAKVDNVTLDTFTPPPPTSSSSTEEVPKKQRLKGTLHLTPHHLLFTPASTGVDTPSAEIWIPYPSITLLTRLPQTFGGVYPLQIRTRTFESYVLGFEKAMEGGAEDVWNSVKDSAVVASVEQLYAFNYTLPASSSSSPPSNGWSSFNPRTEFTRQGVGSRTKAWRFTDINKDYSFSPTYPAKMVIPSRISDSVLAHAGKYRSKARIPALTYLHWANHASITRSSQPMVGLKNSRSSQDERLVECIFTSHLFPENAYNPSSSPVEHVYGATSTNLIIDARPTANAMANVAVGAGTENMDNYKMAKKAYLGIDNIHVMRNSLKTIVEAIRDAESTGAQLDRGLLRKSNWLKHISTVLDGSLAIIRNIHLNASHVLIHCSDGWDRTAQLSAVAQVCLDPYYRTFEGFKVLVEKDWVAFGHKFLDRSGHLSNEKLFTVTDPPDEDSDEEGGGGGGAQRAAQAFFASVQKQFKSDNHSKEISPVFHQFLDCVRQIQRQYPDRFEFNEDYLIDLHYHLYSCQFGTFLFNNEKQRRVPAFDSGRDAQPYIDRTVSAWDWLDLPEQRKKHRNESYEPKLDDREQRGSAETDQGVLLFDPRDVKFWHRLFRRGDDEMNGSRLATTLQPGAEVATVLPGEADPATPDGVLVGAPGVEGASHNPLQIPMPTSRGPSPQPFALDGRSSPAARALNGASGKGTYRAIDSTSSAFSLQTQATPSPVTDSAAFPLPSTGPSRATARRSGTQLSQSGSGAGGWGWSQLSSGALSALSRGAKEIRTIGEGAYSHIRAEIDATDGRDGGREMSGATAAVGYGRPGQISASGSIPRLPSEANPWATTDQDATESDSRAAPPRSESLNRSNKADWERANASPWGDDTPEAPRLNTAQRTPPTTGSSGNATPATTSPSSQAGLHRSLAELSLLEDAYNRNDRSTTTTNPTKKEDGAPKSRVNDSSVSRTKEQDKEMMDALGGDQKAWDPLGAS